MSSLVLLVLVVMLGAALAAAAFLLLRGSGTAVGAGPRASDLYVLRDSLFTPAERSFLGVLESLELAHVAIAAKVRLADIFQIAKAADRALATTARNRITAKHVDFLLIRRSDGRPLLGIELDDASHGRADRVERDRFVDEVFAQAGLPLLHVPAKQAYDPRELQQQVAAQLGSGASPAAAR